MRRRILMMMWLLCSLTVALWGQSDGKKEPKLLEAIRQVSGEKQ